MSTISEKLFYWKEYTEGKKPIIEKNLSVPQLATKALQDLETIQHQNNRLNKTTLCDMCELTETIERIVYSIIQYRERLLDENQIQVSLGQLGKNGTFVTNTIQNSDIPELEALFAVDRLHSMNPNTPALEALIGDQGLLSKKVLSRALGIKTKEVMRRCFKNAKIESVQDLIILFENNIHSKKNILKLIKDHLDDSREEARSRMDPKIQKDFDEQWNNSLYRKRWISRGKMTTFNNITPEKIDAWDFLKQVSFLEELKNLSSDEEIFHLTLLYKGDKGDLILKIHNIMFHNSLRNMLGDDNFDKLKKSDNYLWSPDGQTFYMMNRTGFREYSGGDKFSYHVSFETNEESLSNEVRVNFNQIYASLKGKNKQHLATYERQNLESIRQLFASIRSNEIQLVPFIIARKPEYLFFNSDSGQYIYIDCLSSYDDFDVYFGSNGSHEKLNVKSVDRHRDGGTTIVRLNNGGIIYSPTPLDKSRSPMYTEPNGKKYDLTELDKNSFDYSAIGIELEKNPRHTMMDLYQ